MLRIPVNFLHFYVGYFKFALQAKKSHVTYFAFPDFIRLRRSSCPPHFPVYRNGGISEQRKGAQFGSYSEVRECK